MRAQQERQALTYRHQPPETPKVEPGAFRKFTEATGLTEEQVRKAIETLMASYGRPLRRR